VAINDGNGGNNYTVTPTGNNISTITQALLDLYAVTDTKTYDGTVNSSKTPVYLPNPLFGTDTLTGLTQSFVSKNVLGAGNSVLSVNGGYTLSDGNGGLNYNVVTHTAPGTINALPVVFSGTRLYDGTPTLAGGVFSANNTVGGDTLSFGGSASASSKNVGTYSTNVENLNIAGLTLTGVSADNYTLVGARGTGIITPLPVNISATRVYNGLTGIDGGLFNVNNLATGDTLSFGGSTTAASKNVGVYTTSGSPNSLALGGLTLGGASSGNYTLTNAIGQAIITPASLILAAVPDTKTYDGTRNSTGAVIPTGLIPGDSLSNLSQLFDSKNAGSRILSVIPGYTINDGNGGNNYLPPALVNAPGQIDKAVLNLSAVPDSKVYDQTTSSNKIPTYSGLVGGDAISGLSQRFNSPEIGTRLLNVDSGYVVNDGNGGNNYSYDLASAPGAILPIGNIAAEVEPKYGYRYVINTSGVISLKFNLSASTVVENKILLSNNNNLAPLSAAYKASLAPIPVCPDVRRKKYQEDEVYLEDNKLRACSRRRNEEDGEESIPSIPMTAPIRPRAY
jgi:hypothetical protein